MYQGKIFLSMKDILAYYCVLHKYDTVTIQIERNLTQLFSGRNWWILCSAWSQSRSSPLSRRPIPKAWWRTESIICETGSTCHPFFPSCRASPCSKLKSQNFFTHLHSAITFLECQGIQKLEKALIYSRWLFHFFEFTKMITWFQETSEVGTRWTREALQGSQRSRIRINHRHFSNRVLWDNNGNRQNPGKHTIVKHRGLENKEDCWIRGEHTIFSWKTCNFFPS